MNLTLPRWYSDDLLKPIMELFEIGLDTMSLTQRLKRINGGTLIRKVIENINANNNSSEPKIYLYSTHDLTLAAFTRAQGVDSFKHPPYGSAIIVEKYRDDKNMEYIKVNITGYFELFTTR